jgi:hypothetical protein
MEPTTSAKPKASVTRQERVTQSESATPAEKAATAAPAASADARAVWHKPLPTVLPRPTYWPATLAFGIVFLLWGLVASPILTGTGLVVGGIGLIGWLRELLREAPAEERPDERL